MANVLIGTPIYSDVGVLQTPAFDASGDWGAGNPLTNLQDRALWTFARSASAAEVDTRLGVDLGTDRAVRLGFVPKHTLSSAAKWRLVGRASTTLFQYVAGEDLAARGAVFSRASTATYVDRAGVLRTAAIDEPRDGHWINGERTLLLEPQRTNLCIRSEEFDTWTVQNGAVVTANSSTAPDGAMTADTITGGGVAASAMFRTITFTGDGEKCAAIFLKAGTSPATYIAIYDSTAVAFRHQVRVTWTNGVPTLSTASGAGTLYPVEALGNGWYRILVSATGVVAANTNRLYVYPQPTAPNTGTVLAWGAQAEDAVVPSSYIPTAAATVTRAADTGPTWASVAAGTRYDRYIPNGSRTPTTLVAAHGVGAPAYTTGRAYTHTVIGTGTLVEAQLTALFADSGWLDAWPSAWTAETAENLNLPLYHAFDADFSARYWSLQISDPDNADGYVDLHRLALCGAYEPSVNFSAGAELSHESDSTTQYTRGGSGVHDSRPLRRVTRFTIANIQDAEAIGQVVRLARQMGAKGQCVVVLRPGADADLLPETTFLAVPREQTRLEYPYALYRNAAFAFTEEL